MPLYTPAKHQQQPGDKRVSVSYNWVIIGRVNSFENLGIVDVFEDSRPNLSENGWQKKKWKIYEQKFANSGLEK